MLMLPVLSLLMPFTDRNSGFAMAATHWYFSARYSQCRRTIQLLLSMLWVGLLLATLFLSLGELYSTIFRIRKVEPVSVFR